MENQNKSNTTLIKRNKSFFEDEKVMPFALSDNESDSDDEFSLRARNKKGDNMLISKHNKSSRSGGNRDNDRFDRTNGSSSKYADSDSDGDYDDSDDEDDYSTRRNINNNKYNRNIVLDDDTQVIAFSFSDDEDEVFEEENSKFNRRNSPQKAKMMRKKIPRQHESKSSDGESSSEIQEDSDSSPTALYEIETRKHNSNMKKNATRASPSKIADMVCDDIFDDREFSSDDEVDDFDHRNNTRGKSRSISSNSASNDMESKIEAKEHSPKGPSVDKRKMRQMNKKHDNDNTISSFQNNEMKMMEEDEDISLEVKDNKDGTESIVTTKKEKNDASAKTNQSHIENYLELYKYGYCRRDNKLTRCVLRRRYLGPGKFFPVFVLYIQDENSVNEIPILGAQKKTCKTPNFHIFDLTSNWPKKYLMTDLAKGFSKKDGNYVGKLRGNRSNEFTLYDSSLHRQPYGAICFSESKRLLAKKHAKPRSMKVMLPILNEKGRVTRAMTTSKPMMDTLKEKVSRGMNNLEEDKDDFILLGNKLPQFTRGSYRLSFGGRVRTASIKNFQLCSSNTTHLNNSLDSKIPDDVILQMGKYSKDKFHVDFKFPMTAFQAFGLCLAQFAKKS